MSDIIHGKVPGWLSLFPVFLILIHFSMAEQAATLPINQDGKVEYYDSIVSGIDDHHLLWNNAIVFLNRLGVPDQLTAEAEVNVDTNELKQQFGFYLYYKPALTQQVDGVILAEITLKIEKGKYTYRINNFRFIKYARDRYGRFTAESTKKYPLELYYPDSKRKTWQTHFAEIDSKITDLEQKMRADLMDFREID